MQETSPFPAWSRMCNTWFPSRLLSTWALPPSSGHLCRWRATWRKTWFWLRRRNRSAAAEPRSLLPEQLREVARQPVDRFSNSPATVALGNAPRNRDSTNGVFCAAIRGVAEAGRAGYASLRKGFGFVDVLRPAITGEVNYERNKRAWAVLGEGGTIMYDSAAVSKARVEATAGIVGSCFPSAQVVAADDGSCAVREADAQRPFAFKGNFVDACWNIVGFRSYGRISVVSIKQTQLVLDRKTNPQPVYSGYPFFLPEPRR